MSNLNLKSKKERTFDAIVIGSGISGGWAAKELSEKGLKTLVLERGRDVKHVADYLTMNDDPWDMKYRGRSSRAALKTQLKQSRTGYTTHPAHRHWFVNDLENPYTEVKRFDWMRGYQVGGRSIVWGRHSYRLSDLDFEANAKEGIAVDWPIRYKDIAPWYSYVEKFAGISGQKEGLSQLPDGEFLPPFGMNCVEEVAREKVKKKLNRTITVGRVAHLTNPTELHKKLGRGTCQTRNRCMRGCPYGAYFSSNAATLPAANATGNMTLRPHSIVNKILYDKDTEKATGVLVIDAETSETIEFYAKVIFCNASAMGTTFILMNSTSDRFPNGMGNDSGELGHNLMDHHFKYGAFGRYEGFEDRYYKGRRPGGLYIPRFRNLGDKASKMKDFVRGYGYQGGASRTNWMRNVKELMGADMKEQLLMPGPWRMGITGFGECLPYHENKVYLNHKVKDKWGQSTLTFDCEWKENERNMQKDMVESAMEILDAAGFKDIHPYQEGSYPGLGIHEMGTARMGRDPKTSVLNEWNQIWSVKNVFVTDGAAMTSAGCQNPSLTYMALTARAADYAVSELKKLNL